MPYPGRSDRVLSRVSAITGEETFSSNAKCLNQKSAAVVVLHFEWRKDQMLEWQRKQEVYGKAFTAETHKRTAYMRVGRNPRVKYKRS